VRRRRSKRGRLRKRAEESAATFDDIRFEESDAGRAVSGLLSFLGFGAKALVPHVEELLRESKGPR
jgi:hypothetical protein